MNKQTELWVPIVYSDKGEKHILFVIDQSVSSGRSKDCIS
jgi:hypothetical protein